MQNYKEKFEGKKITVMGLGLLGRSLGIVQFLAECGAELVVTDLKTERELKASLAKLRKYKGIKYTLGKHRLADFRGRDMIIKSAGVPLDSVYIKEAKKHKIPIEMDVSLFASLAPEVVLVGVTGTRGKSMTTVLIHEILSKNADLIKTFRPSTGLGAKKPKVFLGGNIRGVATLPLLEKVKAHARAGQAGDILVAELDSWQLQGFGDKRISPHIAVFTSFMPDHMNYYGSTSLTTSQAMKRYFADKANIFKFQRKGDTLIVRPHIKKLIPKNIKSKLVVADEAKVRNYKFVVPGTHQRENLSCAVEVARLFGISERKIRETVSKFKGLEGRLQYLKMVRGIKIYNDNNATTPEATIASIRALEEEKKSEGRIILITGGADKGLDIGLFVNVLNTFCKAAVLLPGSGTDRILKPARLNSRSGGNQKLKIPHERTKDLRTAVRRALSYGRKGDILLFSPAFSSFSQFQNEYERNDLFMKIVKNLK